MRDMKTGRPLVVLAMAALLFGLAFGAPDVHGQTPKPAAATHARKLWDGAAAMRDIRRQLSFGPRAMGAPGHARTIAMIQAEFARLGVRTTLQTWSEPTAGGPIQLTNIIARFDPDNPHRMILGTHYDSIIRAYADPHDPRAIMPGANNSASGVALLLETARALRRNPAPVGVDFIFFDGEEGPLSLGAGDPHWYALGSPHFVKTLSGFYPRGAPAQAVIFDMVCYRAAKLPPEAASLANAPDDVHRFWAIGHARAPSVFVDDGRYWNISDDHTAFQARHIPSFLVIGFQYAPYFNTTADTIDKCSPDTLEAVGDTVMTYIHTR
jgi:Zn-dependent M28 family amino/carboxypeptidase